MIKNLAVAIILALVLNTPALCMEIESSPVIDMYPDERPKNKLIFTVDLSKKTEEYPGEWEQCKYLYSMRLSYIETATDLMLEHLGFLSFPNGFGLKDHKSMRIYGRIQSGILRECLAIQFQYHPYSSSPCFEKYENYTDYRINRSFHDKWNIRKKNQDEKELRSLQQFTECSWKCVDCAIHRVNDYEDGYVDANYPALLKKMYNAIQRKGLQETFSRLAVVVDRNRFYSFYTVFDKEEEAKRGEAILVELKSPSIAKRDFYPVHELPK